MMRCIIYGALEPHCSIRHVRVLNSANWSVQFKRQGWRQRQMRGQNRLVELHLLSDTLGGIRSKFERMSPEWFQGFIQEASASRLRMKFDACYLTIDENTLAVEAKLNQLNQKIRELLSSD